MTIRALAVSDQIDPRIHSASLRQRMPDVDIVFGCGDVPSTYLEFLADALDRPVYYVLGNHQEEVTRQGTTGRYFEPMGCVDVGRRVIHDRHTGLILAGIPGSPRYSDGEPLQYSELQVWIMITRMAPRLLANRLRHGRWLDVLISHSPPRDINDREDLPHRGFKALRTFLGWVRPTYLLHGHVHLYDRSLPCRETFQQTVVINVYPYQVVDLAPNHDQARESLPSPPDSSRET